MIGAAHVGAIAGASQQTAGGVPGAGPHRYWRVLVTAIEGGYSRVGLSEVEFWDRRYARRATGTYAESGATSVSGGAYNGQHDRGSLSNQYWRSNIGAIWISLDAGSPVDIAAVVIWRANISSPSNEASHLAGFDVQYSDDGSGWTTLWSESGSPMIPDLDTPGVFQNPHYAGDPGPPAMDTAITPLHWLRGDGGMYSDTGVTPALDNDGVAHAMNYGSDGTAFTQSSAAVRPTFKTGGLNGKPFLRCDFAAAQRFDDIAITQPSGLASLTPYCVFAVTDNVSPTDFPALFGSSASNGGKIGVYFRPSAGEQIHVGHSDLRFGDVVNPQVLVVARQTRTQFFGQQNGALTAIFSSSNEVTTAIAAANLLWNDGLPSDGYFDGDLYELGYIESGLTVPAMFRLSEYLNAKYGGIY